MIHQSACSEIYGATNCALATHRPECRCACLLSLALEASTAIIDPREGRISWMEV